MMSVDSDHGMMKVDFKKSKRKHFGRNNNNNLIQKEEKEEEIVMYEVVDLSGMSLDSLPLTSNLNLGLIYKLDISNNNLQVPFLYTFFPFLLIIIWVFLAFY